MQQRRSALAVAILGPLVALVACTATTSFSGLSSGGIGPLDGGGDAPQGPTDGSSADVDATVPTGPRTWRALPVAGPPARHSAGMVYDEARQKLVLVGGVIQTASQNETWEWDGTTWSRADVTGAAEQRMPGLAYDGDRKVTVLYGGRDSAPSPLDWNGGSQWISPPSSGKGPPPAYAAGLVYDSARKVLVLFGGYRASTDSNNNETWEWSVTSGFTRRTPPQAPSARRAQVMVYDSDRSRIVLFGGHADGQPTNDLWEYDGTTWTARNAEPSPSPRIAACAAYDSVRKVTVVFGGRPGGGESISLGETWEWDGTSWKSGRGGPPARRACAMAFDKARNAVVMYGGSPGGGNGNETTPLGDTWVYE